jgi:hypothetical protein
MHIVLTDNRLITADCDSGKGQTRPLVRESALLQETRNCPTLIKVWSEAPNGCFISRRTGRQTVGRNTRITLTLTLTNTSTASLRVVEGDEKESLKTETVKYGCESQGTWTREGLRWRGPAAYTKDRPFLSSERAPHKSRP